jgi:uncharacterized protein (DUF1697 family)
MPTYISLLRGINVSGQNKIKMDRLKEMYENLHFTNIITYIQSGNVIFQCKKTDPDDLAIEISTCIKSTFGMEIPVMVFEKNELKEIVFKNPFLTDEKKEISYQHVTFLARMPDKFSKESFVQYKSPVEEMAHFDRAIYLYCPNGYGKTKLTNSLFESKLNVGATTRNLRTTTELLNIAEKLTK